MRDRVMNAGFMLLIGIALGQSLGILPALAANPPADKATFDLVPFRGRIEQNGVPYSSPVSLRFRLYATDSDSPSPDNVGFYEETIADVQPADGNFAVTLGVGGKVPGGGSLNLGDALRANPIAYVGIAVNGSVTDLNGRQRLASAPYATRVTKIRSPDIDPAQINASHVAAAQINASHIAGGQINAFHIAAGQIGEVHVADGAIVPRHLNPSCTAGQVPVAGAGAVAWNCDGPSPSPGPIVEAVLFFNSSPQDRELHADDGRTLCFLNKVSFHVNNGGRNSCEIITNASNKFVLRAYKDANGGWATCEARCLTW